MVVVTEYITNKFYNLEKINKRDNERMINVDYITAFEFNLNLNEYAIKIDGQWFVVSKEDYEYLLSLKAIVMRK